MARIRSVHPGLYTDEAFMTISMAARVLLVGLWSHADDGGGFEWKPLVLKARIFPADNLDIEPVLHELEENDIIKKYDVSGKGYGAVRNFGKWQRPQKPKRFVPMPKLVREYCQSKDICSDHESDSDSNQLRDEYRTGTQPVNDQSSNFNSEGRKVGRKEGRKVIPPNPRAGGCALDPRQADIEVSIADARPPTDEFDQFWAAYPRKTGKDDARKAFSRARKRVSLRVIAEGLNAQLPTWPDPKSSEGRFIPHPATWLNGGRWSDDPAHSAAAGRAGGDRVTNFDGQQQSVRDAWAGVPDIEGV